VTPQILTSPIEVQDLILVHGTGSMKYAFRPCSRCGKVTLSIRLKDGRFQVHRGEREVYCGPDPKAALDYYNEDAA
jgi:hypothetical protein